MNGGRKEGRKGGGMEGRTVRKEGRALTEGVKKWDYKGKTLKGWKQEGILKGRMEGKKGIKRKDERKNVRKGFEFRDLRKDIRKTEEHWKEGEK